MKKLLAFVSMLTPLLNYAQERNDLAAPSEQIHFEQQLSWQQVKEKAKRENKYIFMDVYATWCGPCKKMDKEIYTIDSIGKYVNSRFISVKVQIDTSNNDNETIQRWYADAGNIKKAYKIAAVPTYLFFSPEGEIVHRDLGFQPATTFMATAKAATDKNSQFYALLENYKKDRIDYPKLPYLAHMAKIIKDTQLADKIAESYINDYLLKKSDDILYTKENIDFIVEFIKSPKDKSFDLFYKQAAKINAVKGKRYAQRVVDALITHDEIYQTEKAAYTSGTAPNWNKIKKKIENKYSLEYAERNIWDAQIRWYQYINDSSAYVNRLIQRVDKYGTFGLGIPSFDLNNHAWSIFLYSNDISQLQKALIWSDSAIALDPEYSNSIDTKANLLYKLGKIADAIAVEEKAISIEPENQEYRSVLKKMKQNQPTW